MSNTTPSSLTETIGRIWTEGNLDDTFADICRIGPRLAGSEGAERMHDYLEARMREITPEVRDWNFEITSRAPLSSLLELHDSRGPITLEAATLPGSPALEQTTLEVIDLGRGTPSDFDAAGSAIAGKAVLVQHEFPFSTGHFHRWDKYAAAKRHGAAAFLISNHIPSIGPVVGSSGRNDSDDVPALGLSYEAGRQLSRAAAFATPVVTIRIDSETRTWNAANIIADLPGQTDEWVVLSAHIDGHAVSANAMDNGSGLAVVTDLARLVAPLASGWKRGVRVMFFTFEEWGLSGSRQYVESLTDAEREAISVDLNLDSVTGHTQLNVLTGANPSVEELVRTASNASRMPLIPVRPPRSNSDHWNFQQAGIPALRLIAGYEEPDTSLTRYLLTNADTVDKVHPTQLKVAELATLHLLYEACNGPRMTSIGRLP